MIHTVGPVYSSPEESAPRLRAAYRSSLRLAPQNAVRSIAFPAISSGVYGYPLAEAALLALATCREHCAGFERVVFALFGAEAYAAWSCAADALQLEARPPNAGG